MRHDPGARREEHLTLAVGWGVPALAFAVLAARPGLAPVGPLLVAGAAWAWAVARGGVGWRNLILGACALRALAFVAAPSTSDDSLRYVWEALVLLDGSSPYAFAPDAPELAALRARWPELATQVGHAATSAAYPPLYQAANVALVALARAFGDFGLVERALAFVRVFAGLCDLGTLVALRALLAARGVAPERALVWAWSPLAALEFAGAGHMDAFGILLWTAGLAALERARAGRASTGGVALVTGAALVKLLPAVSLPFALRAARVGRARAALALVLLVALAYAPLLGLAGGGGGLARGLSDYGLRWESTSILYRFVEPPLAGLAAWAGAPVDPRVLGRALVALAWGALAWRTWRARTDLVSSSWTLLAAFLVLSPTLHPWYLCWALPFLACRPSRAWTWLLATAPLAYVLLARWRLEGVWLEPAWLWPLWVLPFLALGLRERLRGP